MKKFLFLTLLAGLAITALAQQKYPWQNPQLPTAERVENLISMLTPEEKVGLTGGARPVTVCDRAATPSSPSPSVWQQPSARNSSTTCSLP